MKNPFSLPSTETCDFKTIQLFMAVLFLFSSFLAFAQSKPSQTSAIGNQKKPQSERYTFKVIPVAGNTFGYEIMDNGKTLIVQETIPAMVGNKGFPTKKQAEKCARFAISKLGRGIMPPTITPEELDSLGVVKRE